jgi:integrase
VRGSIQKKGKTYYAVLALNGKRKWIKGGPTRKDAQRVLAEKVNELNHGTYRELPKMTFETFSVLWLQGHAEKNVKPSTIAGYKHILDKRLVPEFGHVLLSDISPIALQAYTAKRKHAFSERGSKEGQIPKVLKAISPKTVSNEVVLIKEIFKHAYRWGYVKQNPAEHLDRPKLPKKEIEILNPAECKLLLENSSGLYRTAFLTALLTGLRAGEMWALQWGDVDWNSKRVYVRRSVWKNQFQTPKSHYSVRPVDLPDDLLSELRRWKLACPISNSDLVFPSQEGAISCHDNVVKRHFDPTLRKAGLRHVSFHSLRHTNASMRIQSGQNIKYMSTQMGHSSVKVTLDVYGHLFNDEDFNRQQVNLLQSTYHSVRKPLEKPTQDIEKGARLASNPL